MTSSRTPLAAAAVALVLIASACGSSTKPAAAPNTTAGSGAATTSGPGRYGDPGTTSSATTSAGTTTPAATTASTAAATVTTTPATSATTAAGPAAGTTAAGTTVAVTTSSLGPILVGDNGFTLYAFTKDTQGKASVCTGGCQSTWPAVLAATAPVAGAGVDSSKLSVITRADGTLQAAYNGWPLYYYAKDTKAGDTAGQKVGGVWFVVAPTGEPVKG